VDALGRLGPEPDMELVLGVFVSPPCDLSSVVAGAKFPVDMNFWGFGGAETGAVSFRFRELPGALDGGGGFLAELGGGLGPLGGEEPGFGGEEPDFGWEGEGEEEEREGEGEEEDLA
jgi:hypothetical protein